MLSCSLSSKQLRGSNRLKLKSVTGIGRPGEWDIVFNSSVTYITQLGYLSLLRTPIFSQSDSVSQFDLGMSAFPFFFSLFEPLAIFGCDSSSVVDIYFIF